MSRSDPIDLLAIFAHRDDAELNCGGALIKAAKAGYRTAVLDLTQGEMGTRGTADTRAAEASRAAEVMGIMARENLNLPDARIVNDPPTREVLVKAIRRFRPRIVIAPAIEGRHPDHRVTSQLVRDACFLSGLAKVAPELPKHRPTKVLHCVTYRQDFVRPTFVVDISDEFEQKLEAIRCYHSQFEGATQAGEVQPTGEPLEEVVRHHAAYYGSLIRRRYGEPYFTTEVMMVQDIVGLEVPTFSSGGEADDVVNYGSYLALDELLSLQRPRSQPTHPDELLFIIVHQASELWFKAILHDIDGLIDSLQTRNAGLSLWRLQRVNALMRIVSAQLSSLETLPPQHFAEFRGYLGHSSGAQSVQFRAIEAASGLRDPHFMQAIGENGEAPELVRKALSRPTLQELFIALLDAEGLKLEDLYLGPGPSTLFFLAEALLEYEQQFGQWRFKHVQLVERVLGPQTGGTGGTLGSRYLMRTVDQRFFPALWEARGRLYKGR